MMTIIRSPGSNRVEIHGKSTDEKPKTYANASIFYEMDTQKCFMFDEETKNWIEQ